MLWLCSEFDLPSMRQVQLASATSDGSDRGILARSTSHAIENKETKKLNAYDFRQETNGDIWVYAEWGSVEEVFSCSHESPATLPLCHCRAWEQYNADEEVARLEKEEQEEQLRKAEVNPKSAYPLTADHVLGRARNSSQLE